MMFYTEDALIKQKENILSRINEMSQQITEILEKSGISSPIKKLLSKDLLTALEEAKSNINSALEPTVCSQFFKAFGEKVVKINKDVDECERLLKKHHEIYHRLSFHATNIAHKNTAKIIEPHEASTHDNQTRKSFFNLW